MFQKYLFRPHAIVNIMGGIPKPLKANQEKTYTDLKTRHNDPQAKKLTEKQIQTLGSLSEKKNAKCTLTDGAKKYLEKLVYEELTRRSSKIKAKYLDKAITENKHDLAPFPQKAAEFVAKTIKKMVEAFQTVRNTWKSDIDHRS